MVKNIFIVANRKHEERYCNAAGVRFDRETRERRISEINKKCSVGENDLVVRLNEDDDMTIFNGRVDIIAARRGFCLKSKRPLYHCAYYDGDELKLYLKCNNIILVDDCFDESTVNNIVSTNKIKSVKLVRITDQTHSTGKIIFEYFYENYPQSNIYLVGFNSHSDVEKTNLKDGHNWSGEREYFREKLKEQRIHNEPYEEICQ